MKNILEYNGWLNEGEKWERGGWIFIKGRKIKEKNDKYHVFLASVKFLQEADDSNGKKFHMANINPVMFGLKLDENEDLVTKEINPGNDYLSKWVGISGFSLGLNKNKTPFWRNTILVTSKNQVVKENQEWVKKLPDAIFPKL